MARSIIGSRWTPLQRNELNRMLTELYDAVGFITEGTITPEMIANGSITGSKIATGSIYGDKLANNSIEDGKLMEKTVGSRELKDGSILNSKYATRSITWDKLDEGAVTGSRIADGAVSVDKTNFSSLALNKGKDFPMLSLNSFNVHWRNGFLDVKVNNAEEGALYRINHVSKDNTTWGAAITFLQFGKSIDNGTTWDLIISRNQANLPNGQTGIKTHAITKDGIEEIFTVTIDWDVFPTGSTNSIINSAEYIIHPTNYLYSVSKSAAAAPYLENRGVYPLLNRGSTRYEYYDKAILDVRVSRPVQDLNALYRIFHISKDNTAWGDPITFIGIHKSTDNGATWNQIIGRNHSNIENGQTGIQTHFITHDSITEVFTVTIDWSALNHSTSSSYNLGDVDYIIDPNLYSFRRSSNSVVNDLGEDIVVKIDGRTVAIKHKLSDDKNLIVVYDKLKVNEFHEVSRFIEQSNTASDSDFSGTTQLTNGTDWVSPYGLRAVNNPVSGSTGSITVGGAHGVDGGSGFPTGRFGGFVSIKLDGASINDGVHRGKSLELVVDHYVSASNVIVRATGAKRDSLKERRTYAITSGAHKVQVDLTALEDVHLTRYAGLQLTQPDYYTEFYRYDNRPEGLLPIKGLTEGFHIADEKDYNKLDRVALINDSHMLVMITDRNFGIGDGSLAPTDSAEYPQSPINITGGLFGKIYSHNLGRNNNEYLLSNGETISYRGGYHFVQNTSATPNVFEYEIDGALQTDDLRVV